MDEEKFTHASVELPDPGDISGDVKPAETEEDTDDENGVEVKSGTAVSGEDKGWYEVTFEEPFGGALDRPIINATAVQRTGEFQDVQFTPPSLSVDGVDLMEIEEVAASFIDTGGVKSSSVATEQVSVGSIDIGSLSVGSVTVAAPEVGESDLRHDVNIASGGVSLSEPNISTDVTVPDFNVDVGTDIGVVDDLGDIELPTINIREVVDNFNDINAADFTFESALRERNRETGRALYNEADAWIGDISPGGVDVGGAFVDAWDDVMKAVYGAGSTTSTGSGIVEDAWGGVGATLDSIFLEKLNDRFADTQEVAEKVDDAFLKFMEGDKSGKGLQSIFDDFNEAIADDVNTRFNEVVSDIESTQGNLDTGFTDIADSVEAAFSDFDAFVEDELFTMVDDIQVQLNDYLQGDLLNTLEDLDTAIIATEDELNRLSVEMSEEMNILSEDVNVGFEDLAIQIEESINVFGEDLQVDINDMLADIEVNLNDNFVIFEEEVNDTMLDFEEEVNISLDEMQAQVNDSLEDVEIDVNDSLVDLENQINSIIDQLNANNTDLEERINTALAEITVQAETALNESLSVLYETMGMPEGELMVPVQIRNVSNEGFEFLGYQGGTEINWTAMGRTGAQIDTSPIGGGDGGDGEGEDSIIDQIIGRIEDEDMIKEAVREVASEDNLNI